MTLIALSHTLRRSLVSAALLTLAGVLIPGCAVDQNKEVQQYREVLDANVLPPTNQLGDDEALSLAQAMSLANQHNENLGLQGESYVQALIDKNRAVAEFLPTLSFQPSYTIADRASDVVSSSRLKSNGSTVRGWQAPVVGNISLFNGFGDVASLKAAEAVIAQRRELLLDLQSTVLLNVAQSYYAILRSQASVDVLTNSLQLQESRLRDVEQQFKNGLSTRLAVAQTRAQVDQTRTQLIQSASDVRNGRFTLALIIGVPAVKGALDVAFDVPQTLSDEADFEAAALVHRNDLIAAGKALEAARHGVDVAIAQYYPSVSLDVDALLGSTNFSSTSQWNAVLSAHLPLFDAGRIHEDVRAAWSFVRQAALNESLTRRTALHDVQTAYENLSTAFKRIHELEDEVQTAADAYNQARSAYLNGLGINLDVLTAQDQLLQAQLQLTGARFDRDIFYLDLLRSTGQLPTAFTPPTSRPAMPAITTAPAATQTP